LPFILAGARIFDRTLCSEEFNPAANAGTIDRAMIMTAANAAENLFINKNNLSKKIKNYIYA
jgi:hypothetical protein